MHLPAALSSVSLHRRHTAAASFKQETALCLAQHTTTSFVRLWRVPLLLSCCAHFVATAKALLLLVAGQQAFL